MRGKKPIFGFKDSVDLCDVLASVIGEGVARFRKDLLDQADQRNALVGIPMQVYVDLYGGDAYQMSISEEHEEHAFKEWIAILDKITYAFLDEGPEYEGDFDWSSPTTPPTKGAAKRFMSLVPTDQAAWDEYCKRSDLHSKKCREGRELFAKYVDDMWL